MRIRCRVALMAMGAFLLLQSRAEAWDADLRVSGSYMSVSPVDPQMDAAGNVVVGGTVKDVDRSGFLLASLAAADGSVRWQRDVPSADTRSGLAGIAMDAHGNVIIAGYTNQSNRYCNDCPPPRALASKIDGVTGGTLWQADLGNGGVVSVATAITATIYVVLQPIVGNPTLVKLSDDDGTAKWQVPLADDRVHWFISTDSAGDAILSGGKWTGKVAANDGHVLWQTSTGTVLRLATTVDGDVLTLELITDDPYIGDHIVRRRGTTGAVLWQTTYDAPWDAGLDGFALSPRGALFAAGRFTAPSEQGVVVAQFDPVTGGQTWRHDMASRTGDARLAGLAADGEGDVFVHWTDGSERHLEKLSGVDGSQIWRRDVPFYGDSRLLASDTGSLVVVDGGDSINVGTRLIETGSSPPCGNGKRDAGEACDDGNGINGDGCDLNCTRSACGNGELGCAEECDDGNNQSGDGCSAGCMEQRTCGDVDLRGSWKLTVTCDFDGFASFKYQRDVTLTQDCAAGIVTMNETAGCDIGIPGLPLSGFGCDGATAPLTGTINGLRLRMPDEGSIHAAFSSPAPVSINGGCTFDRIMVDSAFLGRIWESYPGRAYSVSGGLVGTYALTGPGGEPCGPESPLPCFFDLSLTEAPAIEHDSTERTQQSVADVGVLSAQQECSAEAHDGCASLRIRVLAWLERAQRSLDASMHNVASSDQQRALGHASRALKKAERMTRHRRCAKDLRRSLRPIREAVDDLQNGIRGAVASSV